jgi:hypothetical protein
MSAEVFLLNPEEYARRAIAALETQLSTAISPKRKMRLESRLAQWKKTLQIFCETNDQKATS